MTDAVTEDGFLGGELRLFQPRDGYRAGGDPVFLSAHATVKPSDRILDVGGGVGTVGLCLLHRYPGVTVAMLEVQPALAGLAERNIEANGFAARARVHCGDIKAPPPELRAEAPFDGVVTNPPWTQSGAGTAPPIASKARGHMEGDIDLSAWVKASAALLRPKGWFAIIHRADRVHTVLAAFAKADLGDIRLLPLYATADKPAIRIIAMARKAVKSPSQILPGLILHEAAGDFTEAARSILQGWETGA